MHTIKKRVKNDTIRFSARKTIWNCLSTQNKCTAETNGIYGWNSEIQIGQIFRQCD